MSKKPTITMTPELALPAKIALEMMSVGIQRRHRVLQLRAEEERLRSELDHVRAAIKVEQSELVDERQIVDELFGQWEKIVETEFKKAAQQQPPPSREKGN